MEGRITERNTLKIFIISTPHPPKNTSGVLRPYSWAKYWARMGHEIDVPTTCTSDSEPARIKNFSFDSFDIWEIDFPRAYNLIKGD